VNQFVLQNLTDKEPKVPPILFSEIVATIAFVEVKIDVYGTAPFAPVIQTTAAKVRTTQSSVRMQIYIASPGLQCFLNFLVYYFQGYRTS
jgi:hypothetical protein